MRELIHKEQTSILPEVSYTEYACLLGRHPRAAFYTQPDAQWLIADIPHPTFNRVMYACFESWQVEARIDIILAQYQQRQLPLVWMVGPSSQPADLGQRLQQHGLIYLGGYPGMVADLTIPSPLVQRPEGLSICCVSDESTLRDWLNIVAIGYAHPTFVSQALFELYLSLISDEGSPCRLFLGYLNGIPATTSLLLLGNKVAGIYAVATLPQFRRKGLGKAITLKALQEARAKGYTTAALASTQIGLDIYRALGFVECCRLEIYGRE